jgi:hypothetical protein
VTDLDQARDLLGLDEKWLQPFDVVDPFSGLALAGCLSIRPDHRYGALPALILDARRDEPRCVAVGVDTFG